MAWNEPPSGNNDKDPWGNPKRGNNDGPPDLDEVFKKLNNLLGGLFGGGKGGNSGNSGSSGGVITALILLVIVAYLGFNSFYTVDEKERGVVLRMGKFSSIADPGLRFKIPLLDSVEKVEVTTIREFSDKSTMLTKDQNIVEVSFNVQWQAADARAYALNVENPSRVLEHASESALRHVVGSSLMRQVTTSNRAQLAVEMKDRLQSLMDDYGTGVLVSQINFADARPPQAVQAAYDDVIKAEADEQRFQNEAESYRNQIIPEARGLAQRQIEEANAYKAELIAKAQGDAERFNRLYAEYRKAPEVTRQRLYLETISEIYAKSNKVLIDVKNGNNLMYLPLDQLKQQGGSISDSSISQKDIDDIIDEFKRRGIIRSTSGN
ncbi:membrane protease subunit, stomatin/prohibitin-like protein [Gynuella sunshinyii YC6258]|uniref:Protein HflK n=2 Tax=Gynuella sunshinyii TaxID=1445505 RepID=A0A0C5VI88_9GAMM|nr:membrane protease subunit, stomatin/prohibitin-like protein [Gynuella sunshinyii YC6258]